MTQKEKKQIARENKIWDDFLMGMLESIEFSIGMDVTKRCKISHIDNYIKRLKEIKVELTRSE